MRRHGRAGRLPMVSSVHCVVRTVRDTSVRAHVRAVLPACVRSVRACMSLRISIHMSLHRYFRRVAVPGLCGALCSASTRPGASSCRPAYCLPAWVFARTSAHQGHANSTRHACVWARVRTCFRTFGCPCSVYRHEKRSCIFDTCVGHHHIGHAYMGHNYIGHNYIGHAFIGHSGRTGQDWTGRTDACTDARTHGRINARIDTRVGAPMHACMHARTYASTHTCTQALRGPLLLGLPNGLAGVYAP